jgi:hypothetical protein
MRLVVWNVMSLSCLLGYIKVSNLSLTEVLVCYLVSLYELPKVHYITKSMWTPSRRTSHYKIMGIDMELIPLLLL